jgi:multidrug resistance efflux pump
MKRQLTAAAVALVLAALLLALVLWPRARGAGDLTQAIATAEVMAADFYIALPVEGVLEAARSVPIINKAPDTEIVSVLTDGTWVSPGDVIMELNPAEIEKKVDRLEGEVVEAQENVRKTQADGEKRVQNARATLTKAEEALELSRVQSQAAIEKAEADAAFLEKELAVAKGQLEKLERLFKEHLVPITDVEGAQDTLRERTFSLEAARRALEQARADAETTVRLREMDVRTAQLDLEQAAADLKSSVVSTERDLLRKRSDLEEAQEQLDGTDIKAPSSGMLLLEQTWDQGMRPLRLGDRVWEGQRVASVIDPSEMWVRCDISEADIEEVSVALPALVRIPAVGSVELSGEILTIDNLARVKGIWEGGVPGKKIFGAVVKLAEDNSDIRPGMGASVQILLEHVNEGLAVPLEAIFAEDGETHAYRVDDGGYRMTPAKVLKRNTALAAVESELREGDVVACEQPPAARLLSEKKGAQE